MKSKKSIGKRIVEWFSDNTWIYGVTITIAICGVLAFVSISLGKEKGNGNNMFIGGIELEWSFDEASDEDNLGGSSGGEEFSEADSPESSIICEEHTWVLVGIKDPTCVGAGYREMKCSYCGKIDRTEILSLGHEYAGGCCVRCGRSE